MIAFIVKLLFKRSLNIYDVIHRYLPGMINAYIGYILLNLVHVKDGSIVVFSHTLGGNSSAFIDWVQNNTTKKIYFLTDDPEQYRRLKNLNSSFRILSIQNTRDIEILVRSSIIITTHGPIYLKSWLKHKNRPKFIEVWHGVGFKGSLSTIYKQLNDYDRIFVSSNSFKEIYRKEGICSKRMVVTGYARTDKLIKLKEIDQDTLFKFSNIEIPKKRKSLILFAPTWNSNNVFTKEDFRKLDRYLNREKILFIYRSHINSNYQINNASKYMICLNQEVFPNTELLLAASNIVITDWSSIYADALSIEKPVIFIDSSLNYPFKGLYKDDRAGVIVKNVDELIKVLSYAINNPLQYKKKYQKKYNLIRNKCWSDTLDGYSCYRYYKEIEKLISN